MYIMDNDFIDRYNGKVTPPYIMSEKAVEYI